MRLLLNPRQIRRVLLASVLAILSAVALTGCLNDLTPQGRWSAPVSDGNFIYIGNLDGVLVRVDAVSHAFDVNWLYPYELDGVRKKPNGLGAIYGAPVVENGAVYAAGYTCAGSNCDGEVLAVSTENGEIAWNSGRATLETKLVGQVELTANDLLLVGTGALGGDREPPGYLVAFSSDPIAGRRIQWRVALDGEVLGDIAVDNTTNTVYVGTAAGTLYAIDISEGDLSERVKWQYSADGAIAGNIVFHSGAIYFGDLASNFYRLNPRSQSLDWQFDAEAWVWAEGIPDEEKGTIYVSTLGGHIYALNISTGDLIWSNRIDGQIIGTPLLFDRVRNEFSQRVLAVPSGDEDVHVLNVNDGQIIGTFPTDSAVKSSPVLINDFIYIHTLDGELKWYSPSDQTLQGCIGLKDGGRCD